MSVKHYSKDRTVDAIVRAAIRKGWHFSHSRRHGRLRSPDGQVTCTIPGTPSDCRALLNFRAQMRRAGAA